MARDGQDQNEPEDSELMDDLLTTKQARDLLNVAQRTWNNWLTIGLIVPTINGRGRGQSHLFFKSEVLQVPSRYMERAWHNRKSRGRGI